MRSKLRSATIFCLIVRLPLRFIDTFDVHSFANTTVSLLSAFVFGTLIGAERQYRQRGAGVRTNALVALGAAAFVDIAQRLAGDVDSLRVIAYVVSGVGFLGAGAIIKDGMNVRGLNTAATLWCSAAVGAGTGSDMLAESVLLTFFIIAGNTVLRSVTRAIDALTRKRAGIETRYNLRVQVHPNAARGVSTYLRKMLEDAEYAIVKWAIKEDTSDTTTLSLSLLVPSKDETTLDTLTNTLLESPDIAEASWTLQADE